MNDEYFLGKKKFYGFIFLNLNYNNFFFFFILIFYYFFPLEKLFFLAKTIRECLKIHDKQNLNQKFLF